MHYNGGYKTYRALIRTLAPPLMPYIGLYLADLTYIDEGNPDRIGPATSLVNFQKHMMTARVLEGASRCLAWTVACTA